MANADDEYARAVAWAAQRRRRAAYQAALAVRLAGSEAHAQQVRDAWQPLLDAADDRARSIEEPHHG